MTKETKLANPLQYFLTVGMRKKKNGKLSTIVQQVKASRNQKRHSSRRWDERLGTEHIVYKTNSFTCMLKHPNPTT